MKLKIEPDKETVLIQKTMGLNLLGKLNESGEVYGKALCFLEEDLKNSPNDAEAWLRKAGALRSPNRQEKAAVAYNKSLEAFDHRDRE